MRIILLAILVASCSDEAALGPDRGVELPVAGVAPEILAIPATPVDARRVGCDDPSGLEFFFPASSLSQVDETLRMDNFLRRWFSLVLGAAGEPSLSCGETGLARYRLTTIPTWASTHYVRVDTSLDGSDVLTGVFSWSGGYDPEHVVDLAQRRVTVTDQRELIEAVERSGFWSMASHEPEGNGCNGTTWVIEARSRDAYHVVHRWQPAPGPFRALGEHLARLGGVAVNE